MKHREDRVKNKNKQTKIDNQLTVGKLQRFSKLGVGVNAGGQKYLNNNVQMRIIQSIRDRKLYLQCMKDKDESRF